MSSTDHDHLRQLIGALFDDVLMPMAERMRANGVRPFSVKPDVTRLSYYARRSSCSMTHDDFTASSCIDVDDFERRLAARWETLGRHDLVREVPRIAAVADAAHAAFALDKQDAEVSPYIYVMF